MRRRLALMTMEAVPFRPEPLVEAKQMMVDAVCSKLKDVNTFTSIAEIVDYSRRHVSDLMKAHYTSADWFEGPKETKIPRATAERFIREVLYRM